MKRLILFDFARLKAAVRKVGLASSFETAALADALRQPSLETMELLIATHAAQTEVIQALVDAMALLERRHPDLAKAMAVINADQQGRKSVS